MGHDNLEASSTSQRDARGRRAEPAMGRLIFWCNLASAAVVCVAACAFYPTARAICDADVSALDAAVPDGGGEFRALASCWGRLAQHGQAWWEENEGEIAAHVSQAYNVAAWSARSTLVLAATLWHALCASAHVGFEFLSNTLPMVCAAAATTGRAAGSALAKARPFDAALGLAREATILGRAVGAALESSSAFLCARAVAVIDVGRAAGECAMKDHGTTCMLTDPEGFDAARHPAEMRWARVLSLLLVKIWNEMQEPDLAYRAFRLVALVVAIRLAWRVLLCAFGTLIKLLMWLLIPRWLLGNRFASTDKMEPTDEGSWSVCGVTCGASGDKNVAFTDHDAVEALVSTNQTTPKQQAQAEHGAREHHASGSTSRVLHKTSHSGQGRLEQMEMELQSRFMDESSSHSLAPSPFKTTDKDWRQDAAASSPAGAARPEDLMISSPNGMQVMSANIRTHIGTHDRLISSPNGMQVMHVKSSNAIQHGVEGAAMNLQLSHSLAKIALAGSNKTVAQEMAGGGWEEEEEEEEKENQQPQMRNDRASVTSMSDRASVTSMPAVSTRNHSGTKMYPGCMQVEAFEAFHQDLALGGVAGTGEDAGGGGSWGLGGCSDSSLPGCAQVVESGDEASLASLDRGHLDLPLHLRHQGTGGGKQPRRGSADLAREADGELQMQAAQAKVCKEGDNDGLTQELLSRIEELEKSALQQRCEYEHAHARGLLEKSSLARSMLRGCLWVVVAVVIPVIGVAVAAVAVKMASSRRYVSHVT